MRRHANLFRALAAHDRHMTYPVDPIILGEIQEVATSTFGSVMVLLATLCAEGFGLVLFWWWAERYRARRGSRGASP